MEVEKKISHQLDKNAAVKNRLLSNEEKLSKMIHIAAQY